ncbi:MAG: hypothetical protein H6Q00_922 [Holophagaceae bacterium]|nr:hypothetical protein [Holophagaceae bacterium]
MHQLNKLLDHLVLGDQRILADDQIELVIRKESRPYGPTWTVFAIDVFKMDDARHCMVISSDQPLDGGKPSENIQRMYYLTPEFDASGDLAPLPPSIDGNHACLFFPEDLEEGETSDEYVSSVEELGLALLNLDAYTLLCCLALPFQGARAWADPNMLKTLVKDWNRMREEVLDELEELFYAGAK